MRKIFAILLVSLTVLTSCSKDDNEENTKESNFLIGKWESKEDYIGDEVSYDVDGEFIHTYTSTTVTSEQDGEFRATYDYTFDPQTMELNTDENEGVVFIEKLSNDKMIGHNGKEGEEYRGTLFHRIN